VGAMAFWLTLFAETEIVLQAKPVPSGRHRNRTVGDIVVGRVGIWFMSPTNCSGSTVVFAED